MNQLPVISDATYRADVHREICSVTPWANPGLKAVVQFAWALTLHRLSQYLGRTLLCMVNINFRYDMSAIDVTCWPGDKLGTIFALYQRWTVFVDIQWKFVYMCNLSLD